MKEVHEKKMVFAIVYWQDLIQNKGSMGLSTHITNKKSSVINNSKQKLLTFKLANCTAVRWFSQKLLPSAFTVVTNGSAFFMLGGGGGETGSFFTGFSSTFLTSSFSSGISSGFLSCFTGSFEFFSDSVFSSLSSSFCLSFFLSFFFSSFSLSLSLSLSLCCNLFRSYLGKYITNKYFKKTVIFKTCFGYNYHCHKKHDRHSFTYPFPFISPSIILLVFLPVFILFLVVSPSIPIILLMLLVIISFVAGIPVIILVRTASTLACVIQYNLHYFIIWREKKDFP